MYLFICNLAGTVTFHNLTHLSLSKRPYGGTKTNSEDPDQTPQNTDAAERCV